MDRSALKTKKKGPTQDDNSSEQNMIVAVRIRPLSTKEVESGHSSCCQVVNGSIVAIRKDGNASMYLRSQLGSLNEYCFDAAFDSTSTQLEVYEKTAKRYMKNVVDGYNVTVFAYGATGAGKTHTMMGNTRHDDAKGNADAGIIPNAMSDIFAMIGTRQARAKHGELWEVRVSFMEVYNEQVFDLLEPSGRVLSIREDQEKGVVVVAGLTQQSTRSADDVLTLIQQGNRHRKTESTMANQVSSRSHAVLQLMVKHTTRSNTGQELCHESNLSMIDLAGSERASATNNRGVRLQEGANINKSLLALANCINALAMNQNGIKRMNVKYRDSKLTHLLKSSLEGKCSLIMIANINPSHTTFEDSHNTLKYANRAKNIKVNPTLDIQVKESSWVEREAHLREENSILRERVEELERILAALERKNQKTQCACQQSTSQINPPSFLANEKTSPSEVILRGHTGRSIHQIDIQSDEHYDSYHEDAADDAFYAEDRDEVTDEINRLSDLASDGHRRMSEALYQESKPIEDAPHIYTSAHPEDDHFSPDKSSEPLDLPVTVPSDAPLKDRIAALSRITQPNTFSVCSFTNREQQLMFDSLLQDPAVIRRQSVGARRGRASLIPPPSNYRAESDAEKKHEDMVNSEEEEEQEVPIVVKVRNATSRESNRNRTHQTTSLLSRYDEGSEEKKVEGDTKKRSLAASHSFHPSQIYRDDDNDQIIKTLPEEDNTDAQRSKRRRSSLLPPSGRVGSRSLTEIPHNSTNITSVEPFSAEKKLIDLKPLTRSSLKTVLSEASRGTQSEIKVDQEISSGVKPSTRSRRNSIAAGSSMTTRRSAAANRDL